MSRALASPGESRTPRGSPERPKFLDALASGALVVDGAMGTQLYERGILFTVNYEELNLTKPELVVSIHEEYVRAGAHVIETNTFGANPTRLARYGLEGQLAAIHRAAVENARRAARQAHGDPPYVAGAIGPTGLLFPVAADWSGSERERIFTGFRAQVDALAEAGADLIMIETMRQPGELRLAIEAARSVGLPLVAQASFDEGGTMADGTTPEYIAGAMRDWGADVVGANCGEGPKLSFEIAARMVFGAPPQPVEASGGPAGEGERDLLGDSFSPPPSHLPICIIPNAGVPRRIDDRTVYMTTPEYFQLYAQRLFKLGVRMVGGCCGTTPDHVRKIAAAARIAREMLSLIKERSGVRGAYGMPPLERNDTALEVISGIVR